MNNGHGPLAGWAVVQCHGLTMIGRYLSEIDTLGPVYELKPQLTSTSVGHAVFPMFLLGVKEIKIPADALIVRCEELSQEQRVRLLNGCQAAAEMTKAFQGDGSSIVVAPAGTRLPPMKGTT